MHASTDLLLELGLILVLLSVLGSLARRFGIPSIPLYLLTGLLLGEGGIASITAAAGFVQTGAAIGVVLLLLTLGLEFTTRELTHSLSRHRTSALLDAVINGTPGAIVGWLLGLDPAGVLALAGATWISSSAIAARLLTDLRRLGNRETPAVLAVLVIEDFAMAVYLPVLAVLVVGGTWWQAVLGVLAAVTAIALALTVAHRWGHHANRWLMHPDAEQLMLRVLGTTLVVAALAELINISAAVGAFLVGLTLTGEAAARTRTLLAPLRDLFAAAFFLSIGLAVNVADLVPLLPAAMALAVTGVVTKMITGRFAATREGAGRRGQLRAGAALVARGEFSIVIIGLAGATDPTLSPLITAYVLILAVVGPVLARCTEKSVLHHQQTQPLTPAV